ncbi:RnfABCDGE type electron transport complex subunit B [Buchnera aphidicola]|uniref:RnfABCDGE type electron transport complex subunit B n=1 Tax=Buchnera aphidicola TaxID=9 RepID=UPI0034644401
MFFFSFLSIFLGVILTIIAEIYRIEQDPIIEEINNLLPQSQCGQCGYTNCYLYAQAVVNNREKINKCLPGGDDTIKTLSDILNINNLKYNNLSNNCIIDYRYVAWINEENCVGCHKCFIICPVDAIIGSNNLAHTVLKKFCTGCNLCIEHCPTNCIKLRKTEL